VAEEPKTEQRVETREVVRLGAQGDARGPVDVAGVGRVDSGKSAQAGGDPDRVGGDASLAQGAGEARHHQDDVGLPDRVH
jgi:hypothetical protein